MPVYSAVKNRVIVITVDGDHTSAELQRVGAAAVTDPDAPTPALILLDVSGAAGLRNRSSAELESTADFFASLGSAVAAVAILAPDDLAYGLMRMAQTFYGQGGMRAEVFRDRVQATAWLNGEAVD